MEDIGRISAVERQKKNKSRLSVFVDGVYLGSVEEIVWARSGLKAGDVLQEARWEDLQTREEARAALDRALKRLASRARSRAEMEQYLAEKGFSPDAVKSAIEKLEGYGYINDGEYAAMYVRDRVNLRPSGRRTIAGELKRLGVEENTVAEALEQYTGEDEKAAVLKQAEKDMKRTAGESDARKRRAKVYAALARRGFKNDLIQETLNSLFSPSAQE